MSYLSHLVITALEITCLAILLSSLDKEFFRHVDRYLFKRILLVFLACLYLEPQNILNLPSKPVINFMYLIIIISIIFRRKFILCLSEVAITVLCTMLVQLVVIGALKFAFSPFDLGTNFTYALLLNLITMVVCILIYTINILHYLMNTLKKNLTTFYFIVFNMLSYVVLIKWLVSHRNEIFFNSLPLIITLPLVFIGGNIFFTSYSIKLKEQAKSLETYNKYMPIITQLLDETRRRQHDFKNHLNTLNGIIQCSDDTKSKNLVKEYINSLNSSFKTFEGLIHINNKVLTAIIYNKIIDSEKFNIDFHYKVCEPITPIALKDYELSEVLNNLLDNAFEAVRAEGITKKHVFLNFNYKNNILTVEVGSTGKPIEDSVIKKLFTKGFTTKQSEGHGYGLYNVRKISDSYKGSIEVSFEKGYNVFKILFYF